MAYYMYFVLMGRNWQRKRALSCGRPEQTEPVKCNYVFFDMNSTGSGHDPRRPGKNHRSFLINSYFIVLFEAAENKIPGASRAKR